MWLVGRLKPGVSINQAQAEMAVLYESTLDEQAKATNNPFIRKMKLEMEPAGAGLSHLREEWAKPLLLLQAVVGFLLLLACTNLASMLLARGAAREHEMALRLSLGAGQFRLARQVLTESLLLSAAGSLLGLYVAYFGAGVLVRIITAERRPGPAARVPCAGGYACAALHGRNHPVDRIAFRIGSRSARHEDRPGILAPASGQYRRDQAPAVVWKEPGGGPGSFVGCAIERSRPVCWPLVESPASRSGFPPRPRSAGDSRSRRKWI